MRTSEETKDITLLGQKNVKYEFNYRPDVLETFDNIDVAKISLYNIVSLEEERGRTYYVDNDFFNNKYSCNLNLKYFCI